MDMIMPTRGILHQCWGTSECSGCQLRQVTLTFHPVASSSLCQSLGVRTLLFVRQACPKNNHCWWHLWLPSDKSTSQSLNSTSLFFLPAVVNGEKDDGIGSGGNPTGQQSESHQEAVIQLLNWTLWKPTPKRIHRETNPQSQAKLIMEVIVP